METESTLSLGLDSDSGQLGTSFNNYIEHVKGLSKGTRNELFRKYCKLSNNDINTRDLKRIGLLSLGFPDSEVDELCREQEIDKEAVLKAISKQIIKDRRAWNREKNQT